MAKLRSFTHAAGDIANASEASETQQPRVKQKSLLSAGPVVRLDKIDHRPVLKDVNKTNRAAWI